LPDGVGSPLDLTESCNKHGTNPRQ